jgi:hypothetical protein
VTIGGVKSALDGDGKTKSSSLGGRLLLMLPKPYRFIEECGMIIQRKAPAFLRKPLCLSIPSRNDQSWLRSRSGLAVCVLITVGRPYAGSVRITVVIG